MPVLKSDPQASGWANAFIAQEAKVGEGGGQCLCPVAGLIGWVPPLAGKPEAQPRHRTDSLDSSSEVLAAGPAGF